jgi:uncharacterized protein YmfQ (DUF2313 family)
MDLDRWVKVFDRLLPRSRLWSLVVDRPLRRFFHGLGAAPKLIYEHAQSVLLEAFPLSTTSLADWSRQFGAPEVLSPEELEAEWGAFGGQSPAYIQEKLRALGCDVYVHEWWVLDTCPPVARDPIALVPTSIVLVNDLAHGEPRYKYQFNQKPTMDQFVSDGSISFNASSGTILVGKDYPCPDEPTEYPVYWYVCGEVWPDRALIPYSKLRPLIRMIYKLKPVHTRVILRVDAYDEGDDYDIQDTWWHPDEWQDTIDGDDEVQDVH